MGIERSTFTARSLRGRVTLDSMHLRLNFFIAAISTALVLAFAAPAMAAPSVAITAPAETTADTGVDVTYTGRAEPTPDVATTLRIFYELGATACAGTAADQRTRANSTFDGLQVFTEPGPFSLTSNLTFATGGLYRFCAYLEEGQASDTLPPIATATAVVNVTGPKIPCDVPRLTGMTETQAKAALLKTGCKVGKITKPKKSKGKKLVVSSQTPPARVKGLTYGTKINFTMVVKKKKKK